MRLVNELRNIHQLSDKTVTEHYNNGKGIIRMNRNDFLSVIHKIETGEPIKVYDDLGIELLTFQYDYTPLNSDFMCSTIDFFIYLEKADNEQGAVYCASAIGEFKDLDGNEQEITIPNCSITVEKVRDALNALSDMAEQFDAKYINCNRMKDVFEIIGDLL